MTTTSSIVIMAMTLSDRNNNIKKGDAKVRKVAHIGDVYMYTVDVNGATFQIHSTSGNLDAVDPKAVLEEMRVISA